MLVLHDAGEIHVTAGVVHNRAGEGRRGEKRHGRCMLTPAQCSRLISWPLHSPRLKVAIVGENICLEVDRAVLQLLEAGVLEILVDGPREDQLAAALIELI